MKLTKPQKLIYEMDRVSGGTISVICGSMIIPGRRDVLELVNAVHEIYRLNEALRIRIKEENGEPRQYITEYEEKEIEVLRFDTKEELDVYAEEYAKEPMDMYGELCVLKVVILKDSYGLIAKLHHIISDAWSLTLIGSQFNELLQGKKTEVYTYSEYVDSEAEYLKSNRYKKDREFFIGQYKRCDEVTYLSDKMSENRSANRKTFVINSKMSSKITAYAKVKNVSVYAMFMMVLATYINRVKMNTERFYIGTAVLNRVNHKEKNTIGMYVNTAPVLMELENEKSFEENLVSVANNTMSVLRHQKFNYGDVLKELRNDFGLEEKLYDVMLSYQNARIIGCEQLESTWYHCGEQNESLQIHIDDRDSEGIFHIQYDYQTDKFSEAEIERLHGHLLNLFRDGITNEEKKLYELEILTPEEKQTLLYDFNDTAIDYPKEKCVHQIFEEQVVKTPDKIAVIACDRTLTYKELNEEANRIAHRLTEKGVQAGDIVAFALFRKSYLIAAMFGILKAGAAYLPIDPSYPQDRIDFMLEDSKAKLCITDDSILEYVNHKNTSNPAILITLDDIFCALHTSGSTGEPKMALLKHGGVMNFCVANRRFWKEIDTVVSATIITFDAFVMDSVLSVMQGIQLVLASEEEIYNQKMFEKLFSYSDKNMFFSTPTKMKSYIDNSPDKKYLSTIKNYVIGGEVFGESLLKDIKKYSPESKVYNIYGPTETTICLLVDELQIDNNITIGKPIANTQIYIVNQYMKPVPIGVTGELCIAGDCVGAGYLNRPELTAEKFIDNPFGEGKLYKTGDLAYWREDGNIVYVGRNDFQVKVRGLRIELGEIENAISAMEGITQSVVIVRKNQEGKQFICAFYTGKEADVKALRGEIGQKLPKYMIPHIFVHMENMPLTTSGKVNRKALPEVSLEDISSDAEYLPPKTKRQKVLCRLMEDVLHLSPIGLNEDFFEMGGDSLNAIEFVSRAHNEGIYFSLQNIFDYPTIGLLDNYMEQGEQKVVSYEEEDFAVIDKLLQKNKIEENSHTYLIKDSSKILKIEMGNILLAGATGYLGIHLLAEFLECDTGIAYCLVRGNDVCDSTKRLKELLQFYFGEKYITLLDKRIKVFCADLQKKKFGLSDEDYQFLLKRTNTVFNAAASVKHYGSYKYFYETNVETVKKLIAFCQNADARFVHTSTLSVSGNSFGDDFDRCISKETKEFGESNLYIEQPLENVYARSKFEAEKLVLEAMTKGLKANIMRMGNLTNRMDGQFQKNYESNAFLQRLKAILDMGIFPEYLLALYVEFTPIDDAARAVMTIARHFSTEQTVFHINSVKVVYLDRLMEYFNRLGFVINTVSGNVFTEALRQTAKSIGTEYIFETFINDMDENEQLNYDSNIRIDNNFTEKYLRQLGFEWSEIDFQYIHRYVEYFRKIGYFKNDEQEEKNA